MLLTSTCNWDGAVYVRYTVCHVSPSAYAIVHNMYRMTAGIFECFIFVYMGSAIFLFKLVSCHHILRRLNLQISISVIESPYVYTN